MISIIFGKTKPINFIIVLAFLFVFYWTVHFFLFERFSSPDEIPLQILFLALLLFSIFVVDFIVKRNKITGSNSFTILFYALLTVVFPETLLDPNAIISSFFLLLAMRRLISISSLKNIKFKIFDATIWILAASLFYDWALLFLILVFATIYMYDPKNVRNWLVPFAGFFTVFMIANGIFIFTGHSEFLLKHYQFLVAPDIVYFSYWGHSTKMICFVLLTVITSIFAFVKLGKSGMGKVANLRLIALSFFIGVVFNVLKLSENVYPVMVTFFPSAVLLTKYIESIKRPKIREIVLVSAVIIPFLVLFSSMAIN